ncbi:uncharacterized protein CCOS01_14971, partial [Colletotrichum costaricense]
LVFFTCGLALLRNALSCVVSSYCCASQFPLVIVNYTRPYGFLGTVSNSWPCAAHLSVSCLVRSQLCRLLPIAIGPEIGRRMLFADTDHVSGGSSIVSDQGARRMHMPPR